MVNLPNNWDKTIRVVPERKQLMVAFMNTKLEYWFLVMHIDLAYAFDEMVDKFKTFVGDSSPDVLASVIEGDSVTRIGEPSSQDWFPMPIIGGESFVVDQYKIMMQMAAEDAKKGEQGAPSNP